MVKKKLRESNTTNNGPRWQKYTLYYSDLSNLKMSTLRWYLPGYQSLVLMLHHFSIIAVCLKSVTHFLWKHGWRWFEPVDLYNSSDILLGSQKNLLTQTNRNIENIFVTYEGHVWINDEELPAICPSMEEDQRSCGFLIARRNIDSSLFCVVQSTLDSVEVGYIPATESSVLVPRTNVNPAVEMTKALLPRVQMIGVHRTYELEATRRRVEQG